MRYNQYRFKFYLNASHHIQIKGKPGEKHPHTWEICLDLLKIRGDFVQFNQVESAIEKFMSQYQDSTLNEIPPFNLINPTLENCCEYFKDSFQKILSEKGWLLLMISMSETPTRTYVISIINEGDANELRATDSLVENVLQEVKNMEL